MVTKKKKSPTISKKVWKQTSLKSTFPIHRNLKLYADRRQDKTGKIRYYRAKVKTKGNQVRIVYQQTSKSTYNRIIAQAKVVNAKKSLIKSHNIQEARKAKELDTEPEFITSDLASEKYQLLIQLRKEQSKFRRKGDKDKVDKIERQIEIEVFGY